MLFASCSITPSSVIPKMYSWSQQGRRDSLYQQPLDKQNKDVDGSLSQFSELPDGRGLIGLLQRVRFVDKVVRTRIKSIGRSRTTTFSLPIHPIRTHTRKNASVIVSHPSGSATDPFMSYVATKEYYQTLFQQEQQVSSLPPRAKRLA